ncbi:MAG: peptidylprolyl isomerase [Acidobacteria bacterium]|nr:peptidylprolyl isomerase [Acidobacteriota bacterium]
MKIDNKRVFAFLVIITIVVTQACSLFQKSEYLSISAADLSTLIERLPDSRKRMLAQNEVQRKELIQTFKKAFSLAQAAEAEGLQKKDKFKWEMALLIDQSLATEYAKRNPDFTLSREEADAYYLSHKDNFEADLKMVSENDKITLTDERKDQFKSQWCEIKVRSEKARQAGLDKDVGFAVQVKFTRANLLANYYSEHLQDRFKLTPEEKSKYIAEHPEVDREKIRQKAEGLLERVKKGESFEKIADEVNDDGTKGRGGDLVDWFNKDSNMDPEFKKAAFALEKGQASNELLKSSFGYHIIRVDDKRKVNPPAVPLVPGAPGPAATGQQNIEPVEEIRARHIYVSTREADGFEKRLVDEKVKPALETAEGKYPVKVPDDFQIKVAGYNPNRIPGMGGGQSGPMQGVNPNEKK